ncbi:hypothetical protein BDZ97DRAFT_1791193 [Flammula alnicola]|nr:hypothetical protein BDZ97DRAFT_1791193 [Flammula alnicola]
MTSSTPIIPTQFHYDEGQKAGVTLIALTGLSSLLAILYLFIFRRPNAKAFKNTHMFGYFTCLLVANILQSAGTAIDFEWVARGGVVDNFSCGLQGGIKHAGNFGASFWSLIISVHIFLLVFLRIRSNTATFIACWITSNYMEERIFLEYFFSFLAIGVSFILYTAVLLRVRGTLVKASDKRWRLKFIGKDNELSHNIIDDSMLKFSKKIIWYPISYTTILLPIAIIRFYQFNGNSVSFALATISEIGLNLMGLANVVFVIYIAHRVPKTSILPQLSIKREHSWDSMAKPEGFLPYDSDDKEKYALDTSQRVVTVDLPMQPANTYVAPESWKTTAPRGRTY